MFRRAPELHHARPRRSTPADLTAIARLFRDGKFRYYGLNGEELADLVDHGWAVVLEQHDQILAALVCARPVEASAWLRAVTVADLVDPQAALTMLLPLTYQNLSAVGVRQIFFAGDESSQWLDRALLAQGYEVTTEVVVYEKRDLNIPAAGNQAVRVRPAHLADLVAVTEVDRICFEPQWTKDDTILRPAIQHGPFFDLVEAGGEVVGYAYATVHFGGRLVHLVRIAVLPAYRNQAIGVRLLAEVTSFARAQGATMVTLNTQAYNAGAQRLYRWFGFVPSGERQAVLWYTGVAANSRSET